MNIITELVIVITINAFAKADLEHLSAETLVPTRRYTTTKKTPGILNTQFLIHGRGLGSRYLKYMLIQAKIYGLRGYAMQTAYEERPAGIKGRLEGHLIWVEEMKHWVAGSRCPGGLVSYTEWFDEIWLFNFTFKDFNVYDDDNKTMIF